MKKLSIAAILGALPLVAAAATNNAADAYFSKQKTKLTAQEKAAIAIAQKWQTGGGTSGMKPVAGDDGMVRFVYGAQQINVVCAVLQVCDIELQPGEQVNNLNIGDTRFSVEPAISGAGSGEVQHLVVKPLDVGLETSLIVTTNRRSYHMRLHSSRSEYMARVGFIFPEDAVAKFESIKAREVKQRQDQTIPETKEYLGDLSFAYDIKGSAPWKPVRVYNDGTRTIIQMPASISQTEAPALLVVRKEGGWFSDDDTVMVNYRVHGDRFIVDTVFQKAILVGGAGPDQDRVTITKEK